MRTTEFKVHSAYTKEDILKMQKTAIRKMRTIGLGVTGFVFVLYLAVVIWAKLKGSQRPSIFSFVSGGTLDMVLLALLALCMGMMFLMPYMQARKLTKDLPGGVLKANYYFYEKTFQYGWGNHFTATAYADIEEVVNLEEAFYLKAKDVSYWVKKSDFEVGTPEEFLTFIRTKVTCPVK